MDTLSVSHLQGKVTLNLCLRFRSRREGNETVAAPELALPTFIPHVAQCSPSETRATQVRIPGRCRSKCGRPTNTKQTKHCKAVRLLDLLEIFTQLSQPVPPVLQITGQMQRQRSRVTIYELRVSPLRSDVKSF